MSGPTPVPVSEIKSYCEMFDIGGIELRRKVLRQVQNLDRAYLKILQDQRKAKEEDEQQAKVKTKAGK